MNKFKQFRSFIKYFSCGILIVISGSVYASYHKSLWPKWEVNNPLSQESISHEAWQEFLNRYLVTNDEKINLINYAQVTPKDLKLLKNYIEQMRQININQYNRKEQLAYWLNFYNALTILTIIDYYPVTNIQEINISPGLFSLGPWGATLVTVNKSPLSLDDINNRIIRPIWNDARTHYALNNATIGAPNLDKQAYKGALIEQQLNNAAYAYINSWRGAQVIEGKLIISKIYEWYEEDFGGTRQDVIFHLLQFAQEPLRSQLKHINSIDSYVYNWHINSPASSNL